MDFEYSARQKQLIEQISNFMDAFVYPAEPVIEQQIADFGANRWQVIPVLEVLKAKAKEADLWNMFMPPSSGQVHVDDSFKFDGVPRSEELRGGKEVVSTFRSRWWPEH